MIKVGRVEMVPSELIVIGERARKEMGDLVGLEGNMKESGLITPLAMRQNTDGTYLLLAGERRFTVLKKNNVPLIPARVYEIDLTELEIKIIEKAENFHRKDMEYYEMDKITFEIHKMQQELHGVKYSGQSDSGWGMGDTADMIGGVKSAVSTAIKRAEAREAYPELFENCKTASDATKVLQKVSEAAVKHVIAQKLEQQSSNTPLAKLADCYVIKDFFEGVKQIPDGIMHLVEVDPPYAIDLAKQKMSDGESKYILKDYNEIDREDYPEFIRHAMRECYRVMAPHSWLITWFAPQPWFETIYNAIKSAGFDTTRMCGIWTKGTSGQNMNPEIRLSNCYEMFFYAWKGQPALNKAGRNNEFHFSPVPPAQKTHPTERPIELMKELYETFAFPGSRVLIPFLGSGNGLLAASSLGMSPIGFDLSKGYKDSFLVKAHLMSQGAMK